jgi:hypothetical protein
VQIKNHAFQLKSVSDHDADPNQVKALRTAVVKDLHSLLYTYSNFREITVADLDPDIFSETRDGYRCDPLRLSQQTVPDVGRAGPNETQPENTQRPQALLSVATGCPTVSPFA